MFALPAVPQDLAIQPPPQPASAAEVRPALAAEILRAVSASTEAEYDEAVEELVENADLPPVPVDMNKVLHAFGTAARTFVQAMGEFAQMRDNVPYGRAPTLRAAIDDVRETVFSGQVSLEWSRLLLGLIESSVALAALFAAIDQGATPSRFFADTLARRSLTAHRELRQYLEAQAAGVVSEMVSPTTRAKVDDWSAKAKADGIHRPFGDHVD